MVEWEYTPLDFVLVECKLRRFYRLLDGESSKVVSKIGVEFKCNESIPVENWSTSYKMALMMRS